MLCFSPVGPYCRCVRVYSPSCCWPRSQAPASLRPLRRIASASLYRGQRPKGKLRSLGRVALRTRRSVLPSLPTQPASMPQSGGDIQARRSRSRVVRLLLFPQDICLEPGRTAMFRSGQVNPKSLTPCSRPSKTRTLRPRDRLPPARSRSTKFMSNTIPRCTTVPTGPARRLLARRLWRRKRLSPPLRHPPGRPRL